MTSIGYEQPQRRRPARGADPDLLPAPEAARHRGGYRSWLARLADAVAAAAAELLALVLPTECACCGSEDRVLCPACGRRLRQLTRTPFPAPQFRISDRVPDFAKTGKYEPEWLEKIELSDFSLEGYEHHAPITAPMAV